MGKEIKSIAFRYGLALGTCLLAILISVLLTYYSIKLNLTILIVVALLIPVWYGGRGPGLLVAIIFEAVTILSRPIPTPDTSMGQFIFGHFSVLAFYVFLVLLVDSRRSAEKKLREQSELLQVTISSIGDAVIATDLDGKISFINPVAESLTGWTSGEACHRSLTEVFKIVSEETRQRVENPFSTVIKEGVIVGLANHTLLISKDGREIPIEDSGAPIKDMEGKMIGVIIVFHDVSERRQIEKERELLLRSEQAARSEAEAAGRLKDEFLATVSHELRTPLTSILGWSSVIGKSDLQGEAVANALNVIERSAKAQAKIVDDILDVSHIIKGKLQLHSYPLELSPIIRTAVETLQQAIIAKSISVTLDLDENAGLIIGDPDRLQQIIWNLVSNAIKFTSSGGNIEIRLREVDSHVELKISDSGIGINKQFLPFVFERFRQRDSSITRQYGGLGLGLSIVRHLVELHGGTVLAESKGEAKGAVFTVRLPITDDVQAFEAPSGLNVKSPQLVDTGNVSKKALEDPQLKDLRILVVDDDADTLEVLKFAFGQFGADVKTADSSATGVETFLRGNFDVIVSDLGMPLEDGYTLIRKIRALSTEEGGKVPAVAVSGYARDEDRDQALAAGFQTHISKPVDPLELASIIARLAKDHQR
jgi:PAS domain S-box-containing protein